MELYANLDRSFGTGSGYVTLICGALLGLPENKKTPPRPNLESMKVHMIRYLCFGKCIGTSNRSHVADPPQQSACDRPLFLKLPEHLQRGLSSLQQTGMPNANSMPNNNRSY